jgi:hypothetical protein
MGQKGKVQADKSNNTKKYETKNRPDILKVVHAELAILRQGMPGCTFCTTSSSGTLHTGHNAMLIPFTT